LKGHVRCLAAKFINKIFGNELEQVDIMAADYYDFWNNFVLHCPGNKVSISSEIYNNLFLYGSDIDFTKIEQVMEFKKTIRSMINQQVYSETINNIAYGMLKDIMYDKILTHRITQSKFLQLYKEQLKVGDELSIFSRIYNKIFKPTEINNKMEKIIKQETDYKPPSKIVDKKPEENMEEIKLRKDFAKTERVKLTEIDVEIKNLEDKIGKHKEVIVQFAKMLPNIYQDIVQRIFMRRIYNMPQKRKGMDEHNDYDFDFDRLSKIDKEWSKSKYKDVIKKVFGYQKEDKKELGIFQKLNELKKLRQEKFDKLNESEKFIYNFRKPGQFVMSQADAEVYNNVQLTINNLVNNFNNEQKQREKQRNSKKKYCYICKKENHNTTECKFNKGGKWQRGNEKKFCKLCNLKNHDTSECRYKKKETIIEKTDEGKKYCELCKMHNHNTKECRYNMDNIIQKQKAKNVKHNKKKYNNRYRKKHYDNKKYDDYGENPNYIEVEVPYPEPQKPQEEEEKENSDNRD